MRALLLRKTAEQQAVRYVQDEPAAQAKATLQHSAQIEPGCAQLHFPAYPLPARDDGPATGEDAQRLAEVLDGRRIN